MNFLNEININEIELLAIDIEGADENVLLDIDLNILNVKYISFEHSHMSNNKNDVFNHFKNNNYEFLGIGIDHNGLDYLYMKS
jgi:hypothetical protein